MKPRCDTLSIMVTLETTATVDESLTLAVLVPQCGVEAGQYEVLVVLDNAREPARTQAGGGFQSWLSRAAGSATPGLTTDAILAATTGEL